MKPCEFFREPEEPKKLSEEEIEKAFQKEYIDSRARFQEIARGLPIECFNEAYQNSFVLATNDDATLLDKERFRLLQNVGSERHGEAWNNYQEKVKTGKIERREW